MVRAVVALAALSLFTACVPEEGPQMSRGEDCLGCHRGGDAPRWTFAGTWTKGSRVTVADAAGRSFTLRTNGAGNFYTAERLAFPLTVSVDGKTMPKPVRYGGCNLCHGSGATSFDEFMLPFSDCLVCHDGATAPRFTAAGTFPGRTATVTRGGTTCTKPANRVGNFYCRDTELPATGSITQIRLSGQSMNPGEANGYLGCNACHRNGSTGD